MTKTIIIPMNNKQTGYYNTLGKGIKYGKRRPVTSRTNDDDKGDFASSTDNMEIPLEGDTYKVTETGLPTQAGTRQIQSAPPRLRGSIRADGTPTQNTPRTFAGTTLTRSQAQEYMASAWDLGYKGYNKANELAATPLGRLAIQSIVDYTGGTSNYARLGDTPVRPARLFNSPGRPLLLGNGPARRR